MSIGRQRVIFLVCAFAGLSGCSGTATAPDAHTLRLRAASSTRLTATVGAQVADLPSVIVEDENGNPVAGVSVTFSTEGGESVITGAAASTNSAGVARLRTWTLGKHTVVNVVVARSGFLEPVRFVAEGTAGPFSQLIIVDGDYQTGPPKSALPKPALVRTADTFGNSVPGIPIEFVVLSGAGTTNTSRIISNADGFAAIEWTLGDQGVQVLVAKTDGAPSAYFTAFLTETIPSCVAKARLASGVVVSSRLTTADCVASNGHFFAAYDAAADFAEALVFNAASAQFDSRLLVESPAGEPIAENDDEDNTTHNSYIKLLTAHQSLRTIVTSKNPAETGDYSIKFVKADPEVAPCTDVFIERGVTTFQHLEASLCHQSDGRPTNQYRIYLRAGSSLSVTLRDHSYAGPDVELRSTSGQVLARGQQVGPYDDSLTFTASADGYYIIAVLGLLNEEVEYELAVK